MASPTITVISRMQHKPAVNPCTVLECTRSAVSSGYCNIHYQRVHRWGNTLGKELKCVVCGNDFYQKSGRQKTCTKSCSNQLMKSTRMKWRSKQHSVRKKRPCSECGKTFMAKTSQLTCSKVCRALRLGRYESERADARRRTPKPRKCAWCETLFTPLTHAKTCSEKCRALYTKARRGANGQELKRRKCVVCGLGFKVGRLNNKTITCSAKCRGIRADENQKHRYLARKGTRRGKVLRAQNLGRRFRLTEEDYTNMLAAQSGKCAICGTTEPGTAGVFAIDHDHKTGQVRGLLCRSCNVGIGNLKDAPRLLRAAIQYLEENR